MKVGVLRTALGTALALSLLASPAAAHAAPVSAASASRTGHAPRGKATVAARNSRLMRANLALRVRLAREHRTNNLLRRRVSFLQDQVAALRRRVARVLAAISDLRLRLTTAFGPWQRALASTYGIGDGLMGSALAGHGTLTAANPVFAHKSMPFGTKVQFSYNGKTFVGVCEDRGPFVGGRDFDLGPKIARELGFAGVGSLKWRTLRRK